MKRRGTPARAALLILPILMTIGCGGAPQGSGRVLVLGLDGADPGAIDLLMSEGKLPNFARLRQEGAYGRMAGSKPLISPVIWTTIATGKTPDQHRIGHFVAVNQITGEELPVTSRMRKVKAVWNILSDAGRKVAVVGWWATWPAETVRGAIVSDHLCYHFLLQERPAGADSTTGVTYPPELRARLSPLVTRPGDLTLEQIAPFMKISAEELARPFTFNDDVSHFKWALATARTYSRIGLDLWEKERPDLLMVYIEGTDSASHLFGHLFRAQGLSGELARQQEKFGMAVEQMYLYADRLVGEFMAAMDRDTTLIVLSDHGFRLGELQDDPSKTRDMRRVSELYHDAHGILYLYGNRIRGGGRPRDPTTLDVAPTLLALAGAASARDMAGRVLQEVLEIEAPGAVPTYETGNAQDGAMPDQEASSSVDPEILEKLRSLGYLETSSPKGDRNMAGVLFESGKYEEAAEAYRKIVERDPSDGAARASLAGALGALGRYPQALAQIETAIKLEPLNPESYHNRGAIHERLGDRPSAIEDYRTALRYNPRYEPSMQALARLTGEATARPEPAGPAEKLASLLAQRASDAARRGDYAEAIRQLDEAQRIAPRFALLYQYRSNVAYLMGDREAAIAALRQGLQIEPDNALFRENLKRLEQPPPGSPRGQ